MTWKPYDPATLDLTGEKVLRCLCLEAPAEYWIAAMPRDVAQPLVDWLQHEAAGAERGYFDPSEHAVAFARAITGQK